VFETFAGLGYQVADAADLILAKPKHLAGPGAEQHLQTGARPALHGGARAGPFVPAGTARAAGPLVGVTTLAFALHPGLALPAFLVFAALHLFAFAVSAFLVFAALHLFAFAVFAFFVFAAFHLFAFAVSAFPVFAAFVLSALLVHVTLELVVESAFVLLDFFELPVDALGVFFEFLAEVLLVLFEFLDFAADHALGLVAMRAGFAGRLVWRAGEVAFHGLHFQAPLHRLEVHRAFVFLHFEVEFHVAALALLHVLRERVGVVEFRREAHHDLGDLGRGDNDHGVSRLVQGDGGLLETLAQMLVVVGQLLEGFHKGVGRDVLEPQDDGLRRRFAVRRGRPTFRTPDFGAQYLVAGASRTLGRSSGR